MADVAEQDKTNGAHEAPEAPETPISEMYRWSGWVHVGPGADQCEAIDEERGQNECSNPLHFHGWCRLPNQFQHRDIREKALAAKARRVRQLRDPESDAAAILEDELDRVARMGALAHPDLVEEIVARDWWRDYLEATNNVKEYEDDDGTKRFEHVDHDMRRFAELDRQDPDSRPKEEFEELERHLEAYNEAVEKERAAIVKPRREALQSRDLNALIDMVRDQRIDLESNQYFQHEYAANEWLLCTVRKPGGPPIWDSRPKMERADPSVIEAIQAAYQDLERTQNEGGGPGNS